MTDINALTHSGAVARAEARERIRDRLIAGGMKPKAAADAVTGLDLGDGSDATLNRIADRLLFTEYKARLKTEREAQGACGMAELDRRLATGAGSAAPDLDARLGPSN